MFQKLIKLRFITPFLLFILIIPSYYSIIRSGSAWEIHDSMQLIRQVEMEKCLSDGQIPCRWTHDLGFGYGYPLFNYYPPMPYIVGHIFRIFNFSFVDTVKLTAIAQIILSAFFMYLLASSLFGRIGGLLSALFFTYAPYHALNIYVRGAMNESWAAVFFPLIFYFSHKFITSRKNSHLLGLSLAFSGLLLSHNPMVIAFTPIFIIWCLFWAFYTSKNKKNSQPIVLLYKLTLSGILSFCLSAFFTLPVLFESNLVQIDTLFTGYYTYSGHFATLYQLFISNLWGNGSSVWGPADGLSFSIGYLHWFLPLTILIFLLIKYFKSRQLSKLEVSALLIITLAFFTIFMSHERSIFIWKMFSPLQKLQFPWRFLNISIFLFSLSIGIIPLLIKKLRFTKIKYILFSLLVILLLVINLPHFIPLNYYQTTDQQQLSGKNWINQISSGLTDYLPKTVIQVPTIPAKDFIDQVYPVDVKYQLSGQKKGTDWQFFNLNLNKPAVVYLSQFAFPKTEVWDNGNQINFQTDPTLGRVNLNLDAGQHQIYIKIRNTPIRNLANIITLISIVLTIYFFKKTWKKQI